LFKKISYTLTAVLLFVLMFSSFTFAADNGTYYYLEDEVESLSVTNYRLINPSNIHLDSIFTYNYIYNKQTIYRDFDGDGVYEVAIIYYSTSGDEYLEVYKIQGQKMTRIFSDKGASIRVNTDSFSIGNVKYDGRCFYETYTYQWGNGRFLRTGYSKTYVKDGYIDYEKPIKDNPTKIIKDERTFTVNSLLKARIQGDYDFAKNFLSKAYNEKINSRDLRSIIPYGRVTAVDIFESKRGDWVVAVIKDSWGQDRVFKFVPVEEKDKYGNFKIDQIVEIPRAN
jgi:hypothetical protein